MIRIRQLQEWIASRDWDEGTLLLLAGGVIGVLSGLGVVAFYRLIDGAHMALIAWPGRRFPRELRLLYWPALTAGALWSAWFVVKRARLSDGQTVPDVQLAVAKHESRIPGRPVAIRTLASAITLGGGGSAGSEGPVAVLGAALGSVLGRHLRIRPRHRKVLVGCGAAAGIAAAFNAPFAGAFFALEEVLGTFSVGAFSPVVIASVMGSLTVQPFLGHHTIFHLSNRADTHPLASAFLYPILGLACGLASALHARVCLAMPGWVRRAGGPAWLHPLMGGLVVGTLVALSGGLLAGNGHLAIPAPIFGRLAWWALLLIGLAKIVATAVTLGSGGSGGVFTPTLFVGAAIGGGVGVLMSGFAPSIVQPQAWALVGMAGLVAGATRAPLTAIFMVFEMTNDTNYIVPLIIVSVVSLLTARRLAPHGLYDGWLAARGEHLAHGVDQAVMDRIHVSAAIERDAPFVRDDSTLEEVITAAAATPHAVLPVLDEHGRVAGLASHHQIRDALIASRSAGQLLLAVDLAERVDPMRADSTLRDALLALNAQGADALPVVDANGVFAGLLTRASVLKSYERALSYQI